MGKVYLVEHVHTGEQFALKVLLAHVGANAKLVKRFKREAWLPARIKSEHVVRVFDVGKLETGQPYMVMELLEGEDLNAVLTREGRLPIETACDYLLQTCEALAEAHMAGIVHRDLKPANLFVTTRSDDSACIKVLDFGISKVAGDPHAITVTSTAAIVERNATSPISSRAS